MRSEYVEYFLESSSEQISNNSGRRLRSRVGLSSVDEGSWSRGGGGVHLGDAGLGPLTQNSQ